MAEGKSSLLALLEGIPEHLPPKLPLDESVDHAPARKQVLTTNEKKLAIRNALRYFPKSQHHLLAEEFLNELEEYGRIFMHRFRPTEYEMKAYPIDQYPAKTEQAAAIMLMIKII